MKHFLIVYNRRAGDRQLTEYTDADQAIRARLEAESETRLRPWVGEQRHS